MAGEQSDRIQHSGEVRGSSKSLSAAFRNLADRLGICLSVLCILHCLAVPIGIALIPALQAIVDHDFFHYVLVLVLPALAVMAFIPGFRKHRDMRVFYWSLPGMALIALTVWFHESHATQALFSIPGSLCLIRAHWINRHLCVCCHSGHGRGSNSLAEIS